MEDNGHDDGNGSRWRLRDLMSQTRFMNHLENNAGFATTWRHPYASIIETAMNHSF